MHKLKYIIAITNMKSKKKMSIKNNETDAECHIKIGAAEY